MSEIRMAPAGDKHYEATVVERRDLSEDLWLVKVNPGGPFSFKAGQYATLGVDFEGKRIERAYSIVSSPYEQEWLEFFVELVPQGELTPHLYKLQPAISCCAGRLPRGGLRWTCAAGGPITCCWRRSPGWRRLSVMCAHFIRTGSRVVRRCRGTTNCFACREAAARGNLATAMRWRNLRRGRRGLSM